MKTITFRPTAENKKIIQRRSRGNLNLLVNLAIGVAEFHDWKANGDLEKLARNLGDRSMVNFP